jgi:hypothetical protein
VRDVVETILGWHLTDVVQTAFTDKSVAAVVRVLVEEKRGHER